MAQAAGSSVRSHCVGTTAVIYASDYLNKLTGERIERECRRQLDCGCRALVIDFAETELVNSIGISILLSVIEAINDAEGKLALSNLSPSNHELFDMLGLLSCINVEKTEEAALAKLHEEAGLVVR